MLVLRSMFRPAQPAPKAAEARIAIRLALVGAKRRKPPVTLPQLRALVKAQGDGGRE